MRKLFTLLIFLFTAIGVQAQTLELEDHWWVPNGNVRAIVRDGNTVYLGGDFTSIGPSVPHGAKIDTASGLPDMTFAKPNGAVNVAVPDGAGGWYIGGVFTQVAGEARN